ncbi:hypothetical protein HHI36_017399 [Cryptolaemus montrouzieri]|uniref:Uncharacterized protein n=1 Tax=Cryptolaemus montrouzieri TaxID=559131 RepID=A0ABD2NMT2_9CUCU
MSRSGKLTAAEAKLKKKDYDRKRREKLKNSPKSLEKLREKERLKYLKKKEKDQVKSFKIPGEESNVRKNLARLMNETPPASPVSLVESGSRVNAVKNDTAALRRRQQLRNRRAILYRRIAKLEQKLKEESKKSENIEGSTRG